MHDVDRGAVAKLHRVTTALVSNLVSEAQRRPEKLREKTAREKQSQAARLATKQATADLLESFCLAMVEKENEEELDLAGVKNEELCEVVTKAKHKEFLNLIF